MRIFWGVATVKIPSFDWGSIPLYPVRPNKVARETLRQDSYMEFQHSIWQSNLQTNDWMRTVGGMRTMCACERPQIS